MKWIVQFVLKQFAKRSDKKTGVAKLLNETDPIVQSNVRNIEIQLKNLGINPEDLTSTDDVLKALNYHNALMNQHLKQQFKGLGLRKGVDDLAKKKDPFQGWTPKVVKKEGIEGIKQRMDKIKGLSDKLKKLEDERFALYGKKPLTEAEIKERILRENKEAAERLRKKKEDPEDFFASGGIAGPLHLYEGGRARFDKGKKVDLSKRRFIKGTGATLGLLSMLPLVGKFFKAAKPISKAAAPAAEVITKGTSGIPDYAYNLIEVVKAKGTKEIMEGIYKRNPPSVKYNYKGVEVVEDGMGNTSVKKEIEGFGVDEAGEGFEGISREVGFDINKGEDIVKQGGKGDDAGKVIKGEDDYFEATVRPDSEGKMKDMEEFISVEDHLDLKKIADEAKDITIKKAEGGRIGYAKGLAEILGV